MISKIIATHWHHDHVNNTSPVINRNISYNFQYFVYQIGSIPDVLKKNNLVTDDCEVWKYPRANNTAEDKSYSSLKNLQEFEIDDDLKLKIYHTPGHTTDHVILFNEKSKCLFSGDTILGEGTAVFEDLHDYMKSLDIILKLEPKVIYPAHGDLIDEDPAKNINFYIEHRNERERQILNAIESSSSALNALQIVRQVYITTPMHLWLAAVKVVNQHLAKLKKEGKIAEIIGYTGTYWQSATRNKL